MALKEELIFSSFSEALSTPTVGVETGLLACSVDTDFLRLTLMVPLF